MSLMTWLSGGAKALIPMLDTTCKSKHEQLVARISAIGPKAVGALLAELGRVPDQERSPSVVVGTAPSVVNVMAHEIYAAAPVPSGTPKEKIMRVVGPVRDVIAVGKNRQYGICVALGRIADKRAAPALSQRLKDPNSFVACAAAEALVRIGDDECLQALLDTLRTHESLAKDLAWSRTDLKEMLERNASPVAEQVLSLLK